MSTQLQPREWRSVNREGWSRGPWDSEPDKIQWVDDTTGLDCLMVRNHFGAWCGYVGLPESHPQFNVEYNHVDVSVHGGLTFSDFCADASRETWEQWRAQMHERKREIVHYPQGDSARAWRDSGAFVDDYDAWVQHHEARAICHVPLPGRPDRVWWLGFDCAHAWDRTPGMEALGLRFGEDIYRDQAYVTEEVTRLAAQLAGLAARNV